MTKLEEAMEKCIVEFEKMKNRIRAVLSDNRFGLIEMRETMPRLDFYRCLHEALGEDINLSYSAFLDLDARLVSGQSLDTFEPFADQDEEEGDE